MKSMNELSAPYLLDPDNLKLKIDVITGFDVSAGLKRGPLLRGLDSKDPEITTILNEQAYLEFEIRSNGENEEYPAQQDPTIIQCAITTPKFNCRGIRTSADGHILHIPASERFVKFSLTEVFKPLATHTGDQPLDNFPPPHHKVVFTAHSTDRKHGTVATSIGIAVRKSDIQSDQWQQAHADLMLG